MKECAFMIIKPSTTLRNNYVAISALAKETREPIYLTRNGEGDMIVMDIEAFEEREAVLDLREKLISAEINKLNGAKVYELFDVEKRVRGRVNGR
jgi:PHD/YefM family antitoxin component YafN of YafNO toxin-antitoxin module